MVASITEVRNCGSQGTANRLLYGGQRTAKARRPPQHRSPWPGARFSENKYPFQLLSAVLRCDDGTKPPATRRSARRQPHGRPRQRARSNDRPHKSRGAGADDASSNAAADHDGPPRRQGGRDSCPRRGLRRRGVRRAGAHRGRRLARVPRRASGAFVAEPPARARSEALRDAAARLACVDAAPRPAARAARPPPPVVLPRPPDRHPHRHDTGTAPRPPRRPTPTNSRRTPRARLHS